MRFINLNIELILAQLLIRFILNGTIAKFEEKVDKLIKKFNDEIFNHK